MKELLNMTNVNHILLLDISFPYVSVALHCLGAHNIRKNITDNTSASFMMLLLFFGTSTRMLDSKACE